MNKNKMLTTCMRCPSKNNMIILNRFINVRDQEYFLHTPLENNRLFPLIVFSYIVMSYLVRLFS